MSSLKRNCEIRECGFGLNDSMGISLFPNFSKVNIDVYIKGENDEYNFYKTVSTYIESLYIINGGNGLRISILSKIKENTNKLRYQLSVNDVDEKDYLFKICIPYKIPAGDCEFKFNSYTFPIYRESIEVCPVTLQRDFYGLVFYTDTENTGVFINDYRVRDEVAPNVLKLMGVYPKDIQTDRDKLSSCIHEISTDMLSEKWFQEAEEMNKEPKESDIITARAEDIKIEKSKRKLKKQLKKVAKNENNNEIFDISSLTIRHGSKTPMEDLDNLIGLKNVKKTISKLYSKKEFDSKFHIDSSENANNLHMCFYGNPGTGKTTVARIITGILHEMGLIKENRCVEINGLDLVGNYVGQTAIITKKIIDFAKGGVLFIDEAYSLNSMKNSYGAEAVSVLLKEMEDNRNNLVIILAGYTAPMNEFLDLNSGFRSRINRYFDFEDYSMSELLQIFARQLKERNYNTTEEGLWNALFNFACAMKEKTFGNGRYVRNYIEKLEDRHVHDVMTNKNKYSFDKSSKNYVRTIKIN